MFSAQAPPQCTDIVEVVRSVAALFAGLIVASSPAAGQALTVSNVDGVQVIVDQPASPRPTVHRAAPRRKPVTVAVNAVAPNVTSPRVAGILRYALGFVGTPYVWGGSSPRGFDCSGYVQYVFGAAGVRIPRTADWQWAVGAPIAGFPKPGDLVFFQTYEVGASHVGIYLGNGWFVQAIAPNVHLSNFNSPYFRSRYIGARRFLPSA
jgi:cell wall-associated NlpC family hydrolase